ncbi:MAG: MATE family efflux transporter [Aerococcus sp.]|nr:MATE family efflux transporter [Aerococcus sp.]
MTFVIMPACGISQRIQPILGNNFGVRNYKRVMATLYQATVVSVGVTCVIWMIVMLFPFPQYILLAFGASEGMLKVGVVALRTNFCITPILGFVMLVTTFFQSIVQPVPSIVITLLRQIVVLVPFIYLFPLWWGINGIFVAQPVSDALALLLSIFLVVKVRNHLYRQLPASKESATQTPCTHAPETKRVNAN